MWKIKSNINKFQIISIVRHLPPPLMIDNQQFVHSLEGKMLGLKFSARGITVHSRWRERQAKLQLAKIRRFTGCSEKTKLILYKTLVRPVLEYPPVPLHTITKTQMLKLQVVQNNALRWISGRRYPDTPSVRELHEHYNIEAMNERLHRLAKRTWGRLEENDDSNYLRVAERDEQINVIRDHYWWPRSLNRALEDPPEPLYTRARAARGPNIIDGGEEEDDD